MSVSAIKFSTRDLSALHKNGVHFVLCRAKDQGKKTAKSAIVTGWQKRAADLDDVIEHHQHGGLLGFVPGRSDLLVVDIDTFPSDDKNVDRLVDRLGVTPLAVIRTPRGSHVYLKKSSGDGMVGNRVWALDGYGGDVRCDRGYVIGWELDKLVDALALLPEAGPVSEKMFPKPSKKGVLNVVGNRNNGLNADVFKAAQRGETDFTRYEDAAIAAGLDRAEAHATIRSASEAGKSSTFPRKDADALEGALAELDIEVRYNLRAMRAELSNGSGTWTSTSDRSTADLRRILADKFSYRLAGKQETAPLKFGAESFTEHLNALLYHREIDPFKAWLEGLPKWDGERRLAKLLPELLGAAEGPLTAWAGIYLCVGAVQRCYEPGGLLREVPILIGAQRTGKSQLLSNLLPPEQPDWFSDSVCVSDPSQKRVESMLGRVIVELSELTGFRRAELESLKAFISRRDDGSTRLAYRRDPETALRRCILIGTSNDVECLPNDPSGNSRFVAIQCSKGSHVEPYMDKWREMLWAEGLYHYRKGVRANMPRGLMDLQAEHGELHRRKDQVLEDAVSAIEDEGPYTITELFGMACPSSSASDRRAVTRLADALRLAGWTKSHERAYGGKRAYLWRLTE